MLEKSIGQLARSTDPDTSFAAPVKVVDNLRELQRQVYEALVAVGQKGMTDLRLQELLGSHGSTYRTRRSELVELGLVKDSGRRELQKGSWRIVWVLGSGVAIRKPVSKAQLRKENKRFRDVFVYAVQYGLTPKEALEALEWVNGNDRR